MIGVRRVLVAVIVLLGLVLVPRAEAAGNPLLSGSVSNNSSLSGATSVAVSGHYAYTTAYAAGKLTAVDISNKTQPMVASSSAFSNALLNASTVNIVGGFAYVVSKNRNGPCTPGPYPMCLSGSNDDGTGNSLTILNISTNPAVPQIVGPPLTDATKLFGAYGVAVSGSYAYVAAQGCLSSPQPCPNSSVGNSFEVVDVSDPTNPIIKASLANPTLPAPYTNTALSHACSVAISGHYAYVTAAYPFGTGRLTIIDIANPLAPKIVSSLADSSHRLDFPVDVAVRGNYAYVADQTTVGGITVVDVSNPLQPHIVASVIDATTMNGAYRIRLSGNFAYVSASSVATVTAIDISNPLSPREVGHLTDSAHLNTTTGLDVVPGADYVIASSPYTSSQSNPVFPPFSAAAATGTISVIGLDPFAIGVTIASAPANPTLQTGASFTFAPNDAVSSVLCSLDGGPLGFCTTATTQQYNGLPPGAHTFTVRATDAAGNTASTSYAWTIQQAPADTVVPSISGTASRGSRLTASNGTWTGFPAPSFAYQWFDCNLGGAHCAAISGATSSSYTAQVFDVGSTLEVRVTGSNGAGSSSATSAHTTVVTSNVPTVSGLRESAKTWRVGVRPAHITARKRPPIGTSFAFTLNEPASVTFAFSRQLSGRKVNGTCRRLTPRNHGGPHCRFSTAAGKLVFAAHRGVDKVSFAGRISPSRKLGPGRYSLTVTATAAGRRSKTRTISFSIVT